VGYLILVNRLIRIVIRFRRKNGGNVASIQ
jgi:hypothetical protein